MQHSRQFLLDSYRSMATIRRFEDRVHDEFAGGKIPGFVHLYAGEEASAVGVCSQLGTREVIARRGAVTRTESGRSQFGSPSFGSRRKSRLATSGTLLLGGRGARGGRRDGAGLEGVSDSGVNGQGAFARFARSRHPWGAERPR